MTIVTRTVNFFLVSHQTQEPQELEETATGTQNKMRESRALQALKKLHDKQNLICVAWSGGKDSSAGLDLVLRSAVLHPSPAPIVVTHADTGIENPEIATYVRQEIESIKRYAEKHNIVVTSK